MNQAIATAEARVVAALEYLEHEVDPIRAITSAERQLRHALQSFTLAKREQGQQRRTDDALTFNVAASVPRNPWPPAPRRTA